MSDERPIVVLSIRVGNDHDVIGVYGPYESEAEAGKHVGILMRDPEMRRRRTRRGFDIKISQYDLQDPSAFPERVEELLSWR